MPHIIIYMAAHESNKKGRKDVKKEQLKDIKTTTNNNIKQAVQTALNGDVEVVVLCGSLTLFSVLV